MTLTSGQERKSEVTRSLRISLERAPIAPSLARAAIAGFTEESGLPEANVATLVLLVSELVSNAVVHSDAPRATDIELRADLLGGGAVRVEVVDRGSGFPAIPLDRAPEQAGGYGLFLVDQQAARWGVDRRCGTRVWFELTDA